MTHRLALSIHGGHSDILVWQHCKKATIGTPVTHGYISGTFLTKRVCSRNSMFFNHPVTLHC